MNIAFRTNATSQIGTGYFMHCLTLADELKKHDIDIRFVSRGLPSYLRDMLTSKNISVPIFLVQMS
jgi:spore coat polysaccharide biosynthesis predicted glycosyltransferase SpsG